MREWVPSFLEATGMQRKGMVLKGPSTSLTVPWEPIILCIKVSDLPDDLLCLILSKEVRIGTSQRGLNDTSGFLAHSSIIQQISIDYLPCASYLTTSRIKIGPSCHIHPPPAGPDPGVIFQSLQNARLKKIQPDTILGWNSSIWKFLLYLQ